jgi:Kef-type K+ transport system membrane component KefB
MTGDELIGRVLLAIAVTIVLARVLALLLQRLQQPPVMAEIVAGIVAGPTLLGILPGDLTELLFPEQVRAALAVLGNVGLVLFMFGVGLELDLGSVRRHNRTIVRVAAGAFATPFALGLGAAVLLHAAHDEVGGAHVALGPFALFIATAMAVTAFPVLVRIVEDRGLRNLRVGQIAVAAATLQDALAWILLTVALATTSTGGSSDVVRIVLGTVVMALVLALGVRPAARRLGSRSPTPQRVGMVVVGLALTAGATQLLGLHAALGAFAFGAVLPRRECAALATQARDALLPATTIVLLPIYFLCAGLAVDLTALDGGAVGALALLMACACVGKLVGTAIPARLAGMPSREAWTLGALLNTRGLVELVVLQVGLTAGVLDTELYGVLVVVAIATTTMTGPLVAALACTRPIRPHINRRRQRWTSTSSERQAN